jgi:beta-lactam-binding protein with PASTA domain
VCANCGADLGGGQALATAPLSGAGGSAVGSGWAETAPVTPVATGPTDVFSQPDRTRVPGGVGPGGWNGAAGPPEPRNGTQPKAPATGRKGADLTLEQTELDVEAGATVASTLTLHNLGEEVERFRLEVNGPAAPFATVDPPDLRMLPDKKQSAVVRFAPPRDPGLPAGTYPFQVVARSTVNPDVVPRGSGAVTVGAYFQLDGALVPEVTRGRHPGQHSLEMINAGNAPIAVRVELHDESDELLFGPQAFGGRLEPGQRLQYPFTVGGPVPWFGRTKPFPFTAELAATGRPQPLELRALRRQLPRFPWWVPTAALALVSLAIAVFALLPKATVPNVVGLGQAAAIAQLKSAGYKPVAIMKPNKDVPAGQVFDTQPKGGSQLPKGESASVFISQGACAPCPLVVPNVVGLPVDEATTQLQRAGLIARRLPRTDASPANTVFDSDPKPGAVAGTDKIVTLSVSTGSASTSASASGSGSASSASSGGAGPTGLTVPNLLGRSLGDAKNALAAAGLVVAVVGKRVDGTPAGQVLAEDPAAGQAAKGQDTVTLTVAEPTVVDLIAGAASGTWTADGNPLTFPTAPTSGPPSARVAQDVTLVDGSTATVLLTQPVPQTGQVSGVLPVTGGILAGDHLVASVGFLQGSDGAVDFVVMAGGQELKRVPVAATDTVLTPLDVDLSGAAGAASVQIVAMASPGSTGLSYQAVWKDLRVSAGGK